MYYISRFSEIDRREEYLWQHLSNTAIRSRSFGKKIGLEKTALLVGLLHDIGKYTDAFQNYIRNAEADEELSDYEGALKKVDHGVFGARYIYEKLRDENMVYADTLALIVCYHHGGLPDCVEYDDNEVSRVLNRITNSDKASYVQVCERFDRELTEYMLPFIYPDGNVSDIHELFGFACEELTSKVQLLKTLQKETTAICENNKKEFLGLISDSGKPKTTFYYHLLVKTIYSILVDADRYESYLFEIDNFTENDTNITEFWMKCHDMLEAKIQNFSLQKPINAFAENIADMRSDISRQCLAQALRQKGIYRLSVPTGGGKTYASFRFAFSHAIKNNMDRIVYVAPYKTIIEQNAESIRKVTEPTDMLLEFHGDVAEENKSDRFLIASERFDSPIICTSLVQFLNAAYAGGTKSIRRLHNFSNSILIFDEVQSVPIKCLSLFNECINYLNAALGCTIILCSATQPEQCVMKHPINLSESSEIVTNLNELNKRARRVNLLDMRRKEGYTFDEAVDFIFNAKDDKKSMLVVTNTVKSAVLLYDELKKMLTDETKLYFLSAHMCPAHRQKKLDEIKTSLGFGESLFCVSTQLIEAGVDISFNCAVRCLAGMDSVAQTLGRVNRGGEEDISVSYLINIRKDGSENISDVHLGAKVTNELLEQYKKIPEKFDSDVLSLSLLSEYYKKYYADEQVREKTEYPVSLSEDIFGMLLNSEKRRKSGFSLGYLFKTAGKYFTVIEDKSVSVIVPYGNSQKYAEELVSTFNMKRRKELLNILQKYTVNIRMKEADKNKYCRNLNNSQSDIYLLDGNYYNENIGVNFYQNMDFLEL